MAHTPGPWSLPHFADDQSKCACSYIFSDSQSGFGAIAIVQFGGENETYEKAKANAKLIAAAPELLEALEACSGFADPKGFVNGVNIIAAIAKAKGLNPDQG